MHTQESGAIALDDGAALSFAVVGRADAPPLLFVNSLGATLEMWRLQIAAFAAAHRVILYDGRGHGGSDVTPGAYGLDRLGRDALQVLDALGVARADICGVSLGGVVAQWIGLRAPERARRLVLANTAAQMGSPESWRARIDLVSSKGMNAVVEPLLSRWFTARRLAEGGALVEETRRMILSVDPLGYAGAAAALRDMDLRRTASLISAPTLVLSGAEDLAVTAEASDALAAALPDVRRKVLPGAHLVNLEQPEAFSQTVMEFLS